MKALTSRRGLLAGAASVLVAGKAVALASTLSQLPAVNMKVVQHAMAAMQRCKTKLDATDRLAIVDFALASRTPRMHLVDLNNGAVRSILVAHGRGSDPGYTGWLSRFSNAPGSYASSAGGYATGIAYEGAHGRSMRLIGLDDTNSNAESREIVVHSAPYVDEARAASSGKIGRSEGCFAVEKTALEAVFAHLGSGRFLYADRINVTES